MLNLIIIFVYLLVNLAYFAKKKNSVNKFLFFLVVYSNVFLISYFFLYNTYRINIILSLIIPLIASCVFTYFKKKGS